MTASEPVVEQTAEVRTWADGFGVWHAEVRTVPGRVSVARAFHLARGAIKGELAERGEDPRHLLRLRQVGQHEWAGVSLVEFVEV